MIQMNKHHHMISYNFRILLVNGPNMNLLSTRETSKYGRVSLVKIVKNLHILASNSGVKFYHFQSNAEHKLINRIHQTIKDRIDFIIINPSALTHTSIALRDALLAVNIPFIEIHLSNIYARESFRRHSYLSDIAAGIISGLGVNGYYLALQAAINCLLFSD